MLDLFAPATATVADPARAIADLLNGSEAITRRLLNDAMTAALAGSDADGKWTQRDSFEALERAVAIHLTASVQDGNSRYVPLDAIKLIDRLPGQTVRSEAQLDFQQFSTPVDIAALVVRLAAIEPTDILLEPSAGNGLLVCQAPRCAGLQLNEIDPKRRAGLVE